MTEASTNLAAGVDRTLESVKPMETAYRICTKFVVSEVIDGEAVIMDLRSGNYFSATGAGGVIWGDLEAGLSYPKLLHALTRRYRLDAATLKRALDDFLAALLEHELVETYEIFETYQAGETYEVREPPSDATFGADETAEADWQIFDPPVLAMHTDMQDLLLLDPIHDVDMAGWPVRKA